MTESPGIAPAFVQDALLRRIADDEPSVSTAALECACLLTAVPPGAIFNAAAELVRKRYQLLIAPGQGPGDMAGWKGTLQKVRRCCRFLGLRGPYSIYQHVAPHLLLSTRRG